MVGLAFRPAYCLGIAVLFVIRTRDAPITVVITCIAFYYAARHATSIDS